jgi:hypothetical protein
MNLILFHNLAALLSMKKVSIFETFLLFLVDDRTTHTRR